MTRLNPPERLVENFDHAPARMVRMDDILGQQRLLRIAEVLSDLLVQTEPKGGGLGRMAAIDGTGAVVCAYLINAATEFEGAWNVLRLANVPGALRQSRVASESVAAATMLALPRSYLSRLPQNNPVCKAMAQHGNMALKDLMTPTLAKRPDGNSYVPARLRATRVYKGFEMVLEDIDKIDQGEIEMLRSFREDSQHPASHGSWDLALFHFQGFGRGETPRAGAYIDETRHETYQTMADNLIEVVSTLDSIGQRVTAYVRERV